MEQAKSAACFTDSLGGHRTRWQPRPQDICTAPLTCSACDCQPVSVMPYIKFCSVGRERSGESLITGELKSKVDRVWDAFWSGGISNPIEVIEQITYLLFIRRLDDLNTLAEKKARVTGIREGMLFGPGQQNLRWKNLKDDEPGVMFDTIGQDVFPFLRALRGDGSTYSEHMKDARFTIPNPALLSRVVDMIDDIPMADRDTNGDLYEYLLSKIASAGVNGQFRTPRHIISTMVAMMDPQPADEICDPACGTAGFLVAAAEHVREQHPSVLTEPAQRKHFHASMFHGYDFDSTMLRIGSMNMLMHGVESPDIRYRDSLSEGASGDADKYTLILANPPFRKLSVCCGSVCCCGTTARESGLASLLRPAA